MAWLIDEGVSEVLGIHVVYLFSAVATLFAASLALKGTLSVIENQNQHKIQDIERSLLAARAALPAVLSSLYQKSLDGYEAAANQTNLKAVPASANVILEKLSLTSSELRVLQECIKYCDDNTARWLSLIISHFQISRSRLERDLSNIKISVTGPPLARSAMEWLLIKAMVGHVFEFSRTGKEPAFELGKNSIEYPIDAPWDSPVLANWDHVYSSLTSKFENTGGWSSSAFQKRLLNSNNRI